MLASQSKCVVRRHKHASTTPNLLPQAIGRKTPDKRNRHALMRMYHAYMLSTIASKYAFSTTFLKAHPTKCQTDNTLTLSAVVTVVYALPKKKTRSMAGFVKMGGKRLRQQPLA